MITIDYKLFGFIVTIVTMLFGGFLWAVKIILNSGIADMKNTIRIEIQNLNDHCKLVSGNLHTNLISETKQRVYADEKLESNFKNHGHKGLDNGGSKVTI